MDFRITGLNPAAFVPLFGLPDAELSRRGIVRMVADVSPGFPDRIELRDAEPGQSLLLLNHVHHDVAGPYRASHAIFVREGAAEPFDAVGEVPQCLRVRLISLRAFDAAGMMVDAEVLEGRDLETGVERLFGDSQVTQLHAHYARRGCFAARVLRA